MLRCCDIMIQKFKYLSQIKCEKPASKSYGVAGVSVVASVMAKSAKKGTGLQDCAYTNECGFSRTRICTNEHEWVCVVDVCGG